MPTDIVAEQKAQHTAGEWHLAPASSSRAAARICRADGKIICMIDARDHPGGPAVAVADAHLIAAAPDLRNAVVGLLNGLEHHPGSTHGLGDCGLCIWMERAEAALQKAGA